MKTVVKVNLDLEIKNIKTSEVFFNLEDAENYLKKGFLKGWKAEIQVLKIERNRRPQILKVGYATFSNQGILSIIYPKQLPSEIKIANQFELNSPIK